MRKLLALALMLPLFATAALDNFANFSYATLSAGIDDDDTEASVTSAAALPTAPFNAVLWNATDYSPDTDPDVEIVRVTGIDGTTLTITRAQEGTDAANHNTGGKTYMLLATITAKTLNTDIPGLVSSHESDTTSVHGIADTANLLVTTGTPGGELGGTWAEPTIDDNVTVTGWALGTSTATTPSANDNDTSLATTAYVQSELTAYASDTVTFTSKTFDIDDNVLADFPVEIGVACSDETTDLTASTSVPKVTFRSPFAFTLTAIRANVNTAPVGSTIIVDVHENGTTVMDTGSTGVRVTIDASEKTSETAATGETLTDTAIADDAEITIFADQVGSSTAGKGLKVWLIGKRSL